MAGQGTVTALQRALDALGLDTLSALREIDGWIASVGKTGERYTVKAKRLEDSVRGALRKAAAGGKERGDPAQLSLAEAATEKPITLSLPSHRLDWTVGDAQAYLEALVEEGASCPCCGQLVKLYRRKLNSNMTMFLCSLVRVWRANGGERVHHTECRYTGHDYPILANFGLARTQESDTSAKRTSGYWEPTEAGLDFAFGRLRVKRYALLFDNRVIGFAGESIDVREALGDAFNYTELMEGV